MSKREMIKNYIDNLSDDKIDDLYQDIFETVIDQKNILIVDKLKPILVALYFMFTADEIQQIFNN